MKFDNNTLNVLRNFMTINPSILFKEGNVITTVSPTKTILARSVVTNSFTNRFAIFNLSRFLGVLSIFNEPVLEFKDKYLNIKDSSGKQSKYVFANESTIKTVPENALETVQSAVYDVSFNLSAENFKEIEKAAGILGLPEIAFVGDGKSIFIQSIDVKNPTSDTFEIKVGETDKNFKAVFKIENIKILTDNYLVSLSKKQANFKGTFVEYWIVLEQ